MAQETDQGVDSLLLVYYHPIVFDLAESFSRIFQKVTIACNTNLKDNYGGYKTVYERGKALGLEVIPLPIALMQIRSYDLVGLDGVFDGDELAMGSCKEHEIPWFCINGYPHQFDEPSQNILAFSWHLPQIQYKKMFPHEGYIKELDWKKIYEDGRSPGKNICVFYPELNYVKRFDYFDVPPSNTLVSFIHRYEECNKWNYKIFCDLKEKLKKHSFDIDLQNFSGLSQDEVLKKMFSSWGLVHLKHGDCPGISVLESLKMGIPVFTMKSFVQSSFNQEILIDGFNAVVADDLDELYERIIDYISGKDRFYSAHFGLKTDYIKILTSFDRQKLKLIKFFERCMIK